MGLARNSLPVLLALCAHAQAQAHALPQAGSARWDVAPAAAEVGEPVRARLVVQHAAGVRPVLAPPDFGDAWLVLQAGEPWTEPAAGDAARATTTWTFELASLESGERALPKLALALGDLVLEVEGAKLAFASLLAEGEDAPRPVQGLPPLEADAALGGSRTWIVWALGGALALVALYAGRRRRARVAPALVPSPSVRLARLEAEPLDAPADVQSAHFALTRLLREAADLRVGRDRSALTDEEWSRAAGDEFAAAGFAEADRAALAELLARAAAVKYGPDRPTHWATREALARARSLAARLEPARPVNVRDGGPSRGARPARKGAAA